MEGFRRRNRSRPKLSLGARLEQAARAAREAAEAAPDDAQRQALLRAARRYQTAARLEEWLTSPGLQPPT
jgi:hypothetical protein